MMMFFVKELPLEEQPNYDITRNVNSIQNMKVIMEKILKHFVKTYNRSLLSGLLLSDWSLQVHYN